MTGTDDTERQADDGQLIARAIDGDQVAYETLLRRYTPVVIGYLRKRAPHDYEDLYQEVMISAFEQLNRVRRSDRFGPWIVRIARSKLVDLKRRQTREREKLDTSGVNEGTSQSEPSGNFSSIPNPHDLATQSEIMEIVDQAIRDLPDRYHLVLHLRYISGETVPSIAALLSMNESTVKMRLKRGTEKIRKSIRNKGL